MKVLNNYNECLTNLACSIRKYFELDYNHNTLDYIDKILYETKPKNVVTILFDGMGSNILDRTLDKDDFLIQNRLKKITSVFPATTVASTNSIITGLNPCESGMMGWYTYYDDLNKVITTYTGTERGDVTETILDDALKQRKKYMVETSISSLINEAGKYNGYIISPFAGESYDTLDDFFKKIEDTCNREGKKYIYAYNPEPDHTMHDLGTDNIESRMFIKNINDRVNELSKRLKDTVIFVVADHGHKNIQNINIYEYKDFAQTLEHDPSLEPRACNFFVKEDKKEEFITLFNKYFGKDFELFTKEDVINSKLFGDGSENPNFRKSLGDYLAIGITDKALIISKDEELASQHAGYTDDEIYVPLIVIDTNKTRILKK